MVRTRLLLCCTFAGLLSLVALPAAAQTFNVQCPQSTALHPTAIANTTPSVLTETSEPAYTGPAVLTPSLGGVAFDGKTAGQSAPYVSDGGAIKCQQVSGGDGYMTEADGNQTYMFAFGPLSGVGLIQNGQPGTLFAADFNHPYTAGDASGNYLNGQPNLQSDGTAANSATAPGANGALTDPSAIMNTGVMFGNIPGPLMAIDEDDEFFLTLSNVGMIMRPDLFEQHTIHFHGYPNASSFYDGVPDASAAINIGSSFTYYYLAPDAGTYFWHCHITPPEHLQMGMVGQLFVRPRQNRVPVGKDLYQSLAGNGPAGTPTAGQQSDLRTACNPAVDILCATPLPTADNGFAQGLDSAGRPFQYAYNDGDGSTRYDVDVPIQIHGFDPNFHFVGMTFNEENFATMKDKYFLLNGRSYPDTVGEPGYAGLAVAPTNIDPVSNAIWTSGSDGKSRPSEPIHTLIKLNSKGGPANLCGTPVCGERALLRIADLDVTEYQTLASLGMPMLLVAHNARLLRDEAGNNLYITTNSITLAGGESLDVILDSTGVPPGTYFLYTPQLDHLSNDAENFGGLMTEIVVQ